MVLGDQEDLHGAISNLVMNAVRYTPAGGDIRIALFRTSAGVRFEVADSGVGILPQHLPRLTERFYRVDVARSRATGGSGLGLAIVQRCAELLGHRLRLRSTMGAGTMFSITVPNLVVVS